MKGYYVVTDEFRKAISSLRPIHQRNALENVHSLPMMDQTV